MTNFIDDLYVCKKRGSTFMSACALFDSNKDRITIYFHRSVKLLLKNVKSFLFEQDPDKTSPVFCKKIKDCAVKEIDKKHEYSQTFMDNLRQSIIQHSEGLYDVYEVDICDDTKQQIFKKDNNDKIEQEAAEALVQLSNDTGEVTEEKDSVDSYEPSSVNENSYDEDYDEDEFEEEIPKAVIEISHILWNSIKHIIKETIENKVEEILYDNKTNSTNKVQS
jgi:hypothetical protein